MSNKKDKTTQRSNITANSSKCCALQVNAKEAFSETEKTEIAAASVGLKKGARRYPRLVKQMSNDGSVSLKQATLQPRPRTGKKAKKKTTTTKQSKQQNKNNNYHNNNNSNNISRTIQHAGSQMLKVQIDLESVGPEAMILDSKFIQMGSCLKKIQAKPKKALHKRRNNSSTHANKDAESCPPNGLRGGGLYGQALNNVWTSREEYKSIEAPPTILKGSSRHRRSHSSSGSSSSTRKGRRAKTSRKVVRFNKDVLVIQELRSSRTNHVITRQTQILNDMQKEVQLSKQSKRLFRVKLRKTQFEAKKISPEALSDAMDLEALEDEQPSTSAAAAANALGPPDPSLPQTRFVDQAAVEKAYRLGLATLLSESNVASIYRALLDRRALTVLRYTTDKFWLFDVIRAFSDGDVQKFLALRDYWIQEPVLASIEPRLRERICIISIVEMAKARQRMQREQSVVTLYFEDIAAEVPVSMLDIEKLVHKAMLLGLIRGRVEPSLGCVRMNFITSN